MKRIAILTSTLALGAVVLGPFGMAREPAPVALAAPIVLDDKNLIADVAERVTPSVVTVSSSTVVQTRRSTALDPFGGLFGEELPGRDRLGKSLGSGVIVSAKGLILTNNHVIANARDIQVTTADGTEYEAELVGADPKSDLAVLKLKGNPKGLVPLPFGDSSKMRLGEVVLAVGNPLGVGQTVTMGIISATGRANMGIVDYEDFLQTDAAINPGNSGGALVNLKGELIGIPTAIASRTGGHQGLGFAIPSDMIDPIMKMLVDKGRVVRGWLGVGIQDVDKALAETLKLPQKKGVLLTEVVDGSPAAKAGLSRGDLVVSVAGKPTPRSANLRNVVAMAAGRTVAVEYFRGAEKRTVQVAVVEQPESRPLASSAGGTSTPAAKAGKLGVQVAPLSGELRRKFNLPGQLDSGVVVTGVTRGSAAEELGLQPGDVLIEVNRTAIKTPKDLETQVAKAGRRLALLVYRDGATVYLMIQK
jgi:serine protease Do